MTYIISFDALLAHAGIKPDNFRTLPDGTSFLEKALLTTLKHNQELTCRREPQRPVFSFCCRNHILVFSFQPESWAICEHYIDDYGLTFDTAICEVILMLMRS